MTFQHVLMPQIAPNTETTSCQFPAVRRVHAGLLVGPSKIVVQFYGTLPATPRTMKRSMSLVSQKEMLIPLNTGTSMESLMGTILHQIIQQHCLDIPRTAQRAHDVIMTSYQRRCDVPAGRDATEPEKNSTERIDINACIRP